MMQDSYAATRLENDIYGFINVGVLLRKKVIGDKIRRYIDQICFFDRVHNKNMMSLVVEDGQLASLDIPANVMKKFKWSGINSPFTESEGNHE